MSKPIVVARIDRSDRVSGLLDVDDGAQDVDVTRVGVVAVGTQPARWWPSTIAVFVDDRAVGGAGRRAQGDRSGPVVAKAAEVARQDIGIRGRVDRAVGGIRAAERPRVARRQVVGQGHARGGARAEVRDDDREGRRRAGVDRAAIRRLLDLDIRAEDGHLSRVGVGAVVVRRDLAGVVDLARRLALVVALVSVTVPLTGAAFGKFGLPAIVPTLQVRTSAALSVQVEPVPVEPLMDQFRPPAVGSVSLTTTPVALPSPSFVQLSVKLMSVPADSLPLFGVLTIWTSAGMTRKHSVVSLVCSPARYSEPSAGVYSARKQYQPSAVGVNAIGRRRLVVDGLGGADLACRRWSSPGLRAAGAADEELDRALDLAVGATERGDVDDRLALVDAADVLAVLLDLGLDVRRLRRCRGCPARSP